MGECTDQCDVDWALGLSMQCNVNLIVSENGLPSLLDVIACDCALVRLQVCLCDTVETDNLLPELRALYHTIFDCCR